MKKLYFLFLLLITGTVSYGQVTLANWNFEGITVSTTAATTPSLTAGSFEADLGTLKTGSVFTGFHSSGSTGWTTPAGNGSSKSISSNYWGIGDYYQFMFITTGYSGISITWDQTGSNTGPKDFKVQYSTDGTNYTDAIGVNSTYALIVSNWTSGTNYPAHTRTLDLSSVTAIDNQSNVYIRLVNSTTVSINSGTVATGGTGRIDDFKVIASTTLSVGKNEIANFSLYPNPVKGGKVFLSSANNYAERSVAIYDVLGKQVVSQKGTQNSIEVSHLNKGVYIIKVAEEGKVATRKLVIE